MLEERIEKKIKGKNYTDLEIARLIYMELGKILSFNTTLRNTDMYQFATIFKEEADCKTFNQNQVICRTWAQLYSQLLTKFNIKNELIDKEHMYVEFYIDGVRWIADATDGNYMDLDRIKNGEPTLKFGISAMRGNRHLNFISYNEQIEQQLLEIDKKLGYYDRVQEINNLKNVLEKIKSGKLDIEKEFHVKCANYDHLLLLKLEYLFSKIGVMKDSYYGSKEMIHSLEKLLLTNEEIKKISGTELKRYNSTNNVDIVLCLNVKLDNQYAYYLVAPNLPIRKVSYEELVNLAVLGYGTDKKEIPGVDFPNKFVAGKKVHKKNFIARIKLLKNSPYLKDYDQEQFRRIA